MSTQLLKFKQFFGRLFEAYSFKRPSRLPQGVTEFNDWSNSIIFYYKLPANGSVKFMLATMILHAKEDAAYLSKEYFGLRAVKSAANQVAAGVMQELKAKQAADIAAAEAKPPSILTVVSDN